MSETAKIELDGKVYELPVAVGTENEKAIDISKLRDLTGYITLDTGYKNTGATKALLPILTAKKVSYTIVVIPSNNSQRKQPF